MGHGQGITKLDPCRKEPAISSLGNIGLTLGKLCLMNSVAPITAARLWSNTASGGRTSFAERVASKLPEDVLQ